MRRLLHGWTWRRRIIASVCTLGVALLMMPASIYVAAWVLPYRDGREHLPPRSLEYRDRSGELVQQLTSPRGDWCVPLTATSACGAWLPMAVIAVEDRRFREHAGVDWWAMGGGLLGHLGFGMPRGASTLTMQVERLRTAQLEQPAPRSLATKWSEAVRALQSERQLSKDALLLEWLNRAPFGANIVGCEAASRRWFGCSSRELTLAQAALLAGLPQRPTALRPDRNPAAALQRRNVILALMRNQGMISATLCAQASAQPIQLRQALSTDAERTWRSAPISSDEVVKDDGQTLITTRDAANERLAGEALQRGLQHHSSDLSAAIVVRDWRSGQVIAAVAYDSADTPGADAERFACDYTRAARSPGSALKPFIYAIAMSDGLCRSDSLIDDGARGWSGWQPTNIDDASMGTLTIAESMNLSRNLPALEMARRIGLPRLGEQLALFGLRNAEHDMRRAGLSVAIGGIDVSPRALSSAYATLARRAAAEHGHAATAARAVLAALADPARIADQSPHAAALELSWKTGTSSGNRDAWCAGIGSTVTCVVWVGVREGSGRNDLSGLRTAAPICWDVLAALDRKPTSWRRDAQSEVPTTASRRLITQHPLVITAPIDGAVILGEAEPVSLHATSTRTTPVLLGSSGGSGERWWFDGATCLGQARSDGSLRWLATPGEHHLRVIDARGHSSMVRVEVR